MLRNAAFAMAILSLVVGCATSMGVDQFYAEFPQQTESMYLTLIDSKLAERNGDCLILGSHTYRAPIGFTVQDDVRNGAEGLDSIVSNAGGNAYRLQTFQWIQVDTSGTTQLILDFDSMICNLSENISDADDSKKTAMLLD